MQLFERDVRGVRLTEEGRAWTEVARMHYEGLQAAFRDARNSGNAKTLRIGLCAVGGGQFLKRLIDRFRNQHPHVSLAIEDILREQCLHSRPLRHHLCAWVRRSHLLPRRDVLAGAYLFSCPPVIPLPKAGGQTGMQCRAGRNQRTAAGLAYPEGIVTDACRPTVNMCQGGQASVICQLGHGVTLAGESFARNVAFDATVWKPIDGRNGLCSIKAFWLETNPKRAVLRLIGLARNMANMIPSATLAQCKPLVAMSRSLPRRGFSEQGRIGQTASCHSTSDPATSGNAHSGPPNLDDLDKMAGHIAPEDQAPRRACRRRLSHGAAWRGKRRSCFWIIVSQPPERSSVACVAVRQWDACIADPLD
ncbi:hypothetical protein ACVOMV_29345 [Mesorhizobium atlanticum]